MFNTSLTAVTVPDVFKEAHVTPLLKKQGRDDEASYRPVSNLKVLSKTPERIVSCQIEAYLTAASLLPPLQSQFTEGVTHRRPR